MAVAGITIDRAHDGFPSKHSEFIPLLRKMGVETETSVKWTEKMKRALEETEFKKGDINNFWDE